MNKKEQKELLEFTKDLAIKAGKRLMKYSKKMESVQVTYKEGIGIATNADIETEKFIIKQVKKKYKDHCFIAEESFKGNFKEQASSVKENTYWFIDPLDGTNNFVCGFPYFCVSLGIAIDGDLAVGVVYRPTNGDLFFALKGHGSFFQNIETMKKAKKIKIPSNPKPTKDCIFISEVIPKVKIGSRKGGFKRYKNIANNSRGLRRLGSAALDMCYVAKGDFDGYWQSKLFPWDFAGATVICQEANVLVTDYLGQPFDALQSSVCVARKPLHNKIIQLLHHKN